MKLLLAAVLIALAGCADSSYILIGSPRPRISPASVQIYTAAPVNSIAVALLTVDAIGWTTQGESNKAIKALKSQAAALGANGVLLATVGTASSAMVGNVNPATGALWMAQSTSTVAKATAIFVPAN